MVFIESYSLDINNIYRRYVWKLLVDLFLKLFFGG